MPHLHHASSSSCLIIIIQCEVARQEIMVGIVNLHETLSSMDVDDDDMGRYRHWILTMTIISTRRYREWILTT